MRTVPDVGQLGDPAGELVDYRDRTLISRRSTSGGRCRSLELAPPDDERPVGPMAWMVALTAAW
jgi:hypothetical protein